VSVAGVIEPALQRAEMRRSAERPTTDLTAYDLYLVPSSQLRLSQHGRQRRDSPPNRSPKPERYEEDQGQGCSRVRPIIGLTLVKRLGRQPQRPGATSEFAVHQVSSIWCAPNSLTQFLCQIRWRLVS